VDVVVYKEEPRRGVAGVPGKEGLRCPSLLLPEELAEQTLLCGYLLDSLLNWLCRSLLCWLCCRLLLARHYFTPISLAASAAMGY